MVLVQSHVDGPPDSPTTKRLTVMFLYQKAHCSLGSLSFSVDNVCCDNAAGFSVAVLHLLFRHTCGTHRGGTPTIYERPPSDATQSCLLCKQTVFTEKGDLMGWVKKCPLGIY